MCVCGRVFAASWGPFVWTQCSLWGPKPDSTGMDADFVCRGFGLGPKYELSSGGYGQI